MPRTFVLLLLMVAVLGVVGIVLTVSTEQQDTPLIGAQIPPPVHGDPEQPRRHLRETDAAVLAPVVAAAIYRDLREMLAAGYAAGGDPVAKAYTEWQRFNSSPYASATHGRRLVNNYVNETGAARYGRFEEAGPMPVGTVIAKDSFVVTEDGEIAPGPLFVMEKMAKGFHEVSGDWRYTMILPEGGLFGMTKGPGAEKVEFCIGCHLAREAFDHLYFVPKRLRAGG